MGSRPLSAAAPIRITGQFESLSLVSLQNEQVRKDVDKVSGCDGFIPPLLIWATPTCTGQRRGVSFNGGVFFSLSLAVTLECSSGRNPQNVSRQKPAGRETWRPFLEKSTHFDTNAAVPVTGVSSSDWRRQRRLRESGKIEGLAGFFFRTLMVFA